jgi:hypothetical protein
LLFLLCHPLMSCNGSDDDENGGRKIGRATAIARRTYIVQQIIGSLIW